MESGEEMHEPDGVYDRQDFWLNGCHVDPSACTIEREDESVRVSAHSMAALVYLAENSGNIIDSQSLLAHAWPANHVGDNTVYKAINELRVALRDDAKNPRYIETLPRRGYRLITSVRNSNSQHGNRNRAGWKVAVASSCLIAVAMAAFFLRQIESEATIVLVSGQRIAVIKPPSGKQEDLAKTLELVYRQTVAKIIQLPGATVEHHDSRIEFDGNSLQSELALNRTLSFDNLNDELIVQITPGLNVVPHEDRYDLSQAPLASESIIDRAIATTIQDLETLASDEQLANMERWKTNDIHAYRFAAEGKLHQQHMNRDNLTRAQALFQRAIDSDRKFAEAYVELAVTLVSLANMTPNSAATEEAYQTLVALADAARKANLDKPYIGLLDGQRNFIATSHPMQLEQQHRARLLRNPKDPDALAGYSLLLMGAGFAEEARGYLDRAIELAPTPNRLWTDYVSLTDLTDTVESIRLAEEVLAKYPLMTISLFGLVEKNSWIGEFAKAEQYLERLSQSDSQGAWAHAARLSFAAMKGDLPLKSKALDSALAHPLTTNIMKGKLYFILGDVERGVAAWRNIEPAFVHLLWKFYAGSFEKYFHPEVIADPRYSRLLEDLNVGQSWRAHLNAQTVLLAEVTGIRSTTTFVMTETAMVARFPRSEHGPETPSI